MQFIQAKIFFCFYMGEMADATSRWHLKRQIKFELIFEIWLQSRTNYISNFDAGFENLVLPADASVTYLTTKKSVGDHAKMCT